MLTLACSSTLLATAAIALTFSREWRFGGNVAGCFVDQRRAANQKQHSLSLNRGNGLFQHFA